MLYWSSRVLHTSSADKSIFSHRGSLHGTLITHGYKNVRINDQEIAGATNENDCWFSIGHLFISQSQYGSPGQYWEIVMCACHGNDVNRARMVVDYISTLSQRINP
ncbi:hypothetical protein [Peribacillus butanolivorans]|uniref:hypothetical protein n=1 Tax=Peribacillus butanolivorans TaxID=421767 RepID=UPI0036487DFC